MFNIQWEPSDDYYLIIGKDKQDITREDIHIVETHQNGRAFRYRE